MFHTTFYYIIYLSEIAFCCSTNDKTQQLKYLFDIFLVIQWKLIKLNGVHLRTKFACVWVKNKDWTTQNTEINGQFCLYWQNDDMNFLPLTWVFFLSFYLLWYDEWYVFIKQLIKSHSSDKTNAYGIFDLLFRKLKSWELRQPNIFWVNLFEISVSHNGFFKNYFKFSWNNWLWPRSSLISCWISELRKCAQCSNIFFVHINKLHLNAPNHTYFKVYHIHFYVISFLSRLIKAIFSNK